MLLRLINCRFIVIIIIISCSLVLGTTKSPRAAVCL